MAKIKEQVDRPVTDKALDKIIIDLSERQTKVCLLATDRVVDADNYLEW